MAKYILNQNQQDSESGMNYEVHNEETCIRLPAHHNRIPLGNYSNCKGAVSAAKTMRPVWTHQIDGCYWCSGSCHNA